MHYYEWVSSLLLYVYQLSMSAKLSQLLMWFLMEERRGGGRLGHFYSNGNMFLKLSRDFLIFNVDVPFFNQWSCSLFVKTCCAPEMEWEQYCGSYSPTYFLIRAFRLENFPTYDANQKILVNLQQSSENLNPSIFHLFWNCAHTNDTDFHIKFDECQMKCKIFKYCVFTVYKIGIRLGFTYCRLREAG